MPFPLGSFPLESEVSNVVFRTYPSYRIFSQRPQLTQLNHRPLQLLGLGGRGVTGAKGRGAEAGEEMGARGESAYDGMRVSRYGQNSSITVRLTR